MYADALMPSDLLALEPVGPRRQPLVKREERSCRRSPAAVASDCPQLFVGIIYLTHLA
jgi:hypothetical protein